jgi:V/A-type H+-transporting ATPase subunit I
MIKLRCVAHRSVQEPLLEHLYHLGAMEAVRIASEEEEQRRTVSVKALDEINERIRVVEETLGELRNLRRPERPFLGYFFALSRPKKKENFERTRDTFDTGAFCSRVLELKKANNALAERRRALLKEQERIESFRTFSIPLAELEESKWTVLRMLRGPGPLDETVLPRDAPLLVRQTKGGEEWLLIACPRGAWPGLERALAQKGWTAVDVSDLRYTPQEELFARLRALEKLEEEVGRNEEALREAANRLDDLTVVYDWLLNERERLEQTGLFPATEATVLLEGWARESKAPEIESALKPFGGSAIFTFSRPVAGEKVPIILDNPSWLRPFEFITRMYGLPEYGQVDPTPWLAPFFLLFFSLCLTDAAYGAVLAVAAFLLLRRGGLTGGSRSLVKLLFYGGLATILSGALAGGWFGNILDSMPGSLRALGELSRRIALLDPLQNVLLFMGAIFVLGYFQICVGILIKLGHKVREGRLADALVDEAVWLVFINGLVAWGLVMATGRGQEMLVLIKSTVVAAAGVRVLTYGRNRPSWPARLGVGLASLYLAVGVMSDVLSYARVVALGLATGVIALVVDTLCVMIVGLPWVGFIVAAVVFVVGHSFNIVINVIGAFVHTGRLQFVEFFSKFFVSGGLSWRPFRFKSRYFVLEG